MADDERCMIDSGVRASVVPIGVLKNAGTKLAAGYSFLINRGWLIEQGSDVIAPCLDRLAVTISVRGTSPLHNQDS